MPKSRVSDLYLLPAGVGGRRGVDRMQDSQREKERDVYIWSDRQKEKDKIDMRQTG